MTDGTLARAIGSVHLVSENIELRAVDALSAPALADVARGNIHLDTYMPFGSPWSEGGPEERAQRLSEWYSRRIAESTSARWSMIFAVVVDGATVGSTNLYADRFPESRAVSTGSWLLAEQQGRGIGRRMRRMLLHFAFEHLHAEFATSEAWEDNWPSRRVNEGAGYQQTGLHLAERRTRMVQMIEYTITAERWATSLDVHVPIEIHADDDLRTLLA